MFWAAPATAQEARQIRDVAPSAGARRPTTAAARRTVRPFEVILVRFAADRIDEHLARYYHDVPFGMVIC